MTKKALIFISIAIIVSSCATILNQPTKKVRVYSNTDQTVLFDEKKVNLDKFETKIEANRSNDSIVLKYNLGDSTDSLIIQPKNSLAYYLNAYPTPILFTGFLIDKKNPKRYTFPGRVYLNDIDSSSVPTFYKIHNKGDLEFDLFFPVVNNYRTNFYKGSVQSKTGFWGIGIGLNYFIRKNHCLGLSLQGTTDLLTPFPAPVDYRGFNEFYSSYQLNLDYNFQYKNLSIGIGVNHMSTKWKRKYSGGLDSLALDTISLKEESRSFSSLGINVPVKYQISHRFYLGMTYSSSLINLNKSVIFKYNHLFSISFGWKFGNNRKVTNKK